MTDLFNGVLEAILLLLLIMVVILSRYAIIWHADMHRIHLRLTRIEEDVHRLPERYPAQRQLSEMMPPKELLLEESSPDNIELLRQHIQRYYPTLTDSIARYSNEPLSNSDELLCMLIKLKYTNKEIASILSITNNSVITARYRLKRKLALPQHQQLDAWIQSIELLPPPSRHT